MKTPFLGASYKLRSPNAAADRCVNLYPEMIQEGGSEPGVLYRCPGLEEVADIGDGPIRALYRYTPTRLLVVSGNQVYKTDADLNETLAGTLDTASGPVQISRNNSQAMFTDGASGYIYSSGAGTLAKITDADFTGVNGNTYQNDYFIAQQDEDNFQISALNDGTSWDALDIASADFSPDGLKRVMSVNNQLWLLGRKTTEVWYDSGNADFPFEPIQGAACDHGCMASASVVPLDNTIFWLGFDDQGVNTVYRANGYIPQRISTHAVEDAFAEYDDTSDAIAFAYQQRGHLFYILTFPTGNATWVYDVSTNLWHERAYLNPASGTFERHLANCCVNFQNKTLAGSRLDGKIFDWSLNVYADDGDAQKWLRAWRAIPTGQNNYKRSYQHALLITGQSGTGLISGQGSDPKVMLRSSDDGGHNWTNERWASVGAIGETGTRVRFTRCGATEKLRDRVYELSGTDPVLTAWTGAELDIEGANS